MLNPNQMDYLTPKQLRERLCELIIKYECQPFNIIEGNMNMILEHVPETRDDDKYYQFRIIFTSPDEELTEELSNIPSERFRYFDQIDTALFYLYNDHFNDDIGDFTYDINTNHYSSPVTITVTVTDFMS